MLFLIRKRYNWLRLEEKICENEMELRQIIHKNDKMEIKPSNVELYEILGQGAFGIVRKGMLKPTKKAVAVKMPRGKK